MRIAMVAPLVSPIVEPFSGGSQAAVAELATGLAQRGHRVVLYASQGSYVEGVPVTSLGIESRSLGDDAYRHGAPSPPSPAMVCAYRAIYTHIRQSEWDVVHNHGFDVPAITEAAGQRVAVLHTLHLPPTVAMVVALAQARSLGVTTWCAGVSQSHAATWREHTTVNGVLTNGVAVDRIPFGPVATRRAVIAARFSPEKGVAEGVAAARHVGWPVDLYAGRYDDAYQRTVVRQWASDRAVTFHGPVARERLWRAFSTAAAVLCLSQWDEPFGMVAAEAQAAGAPVVATRRGGLAEIVEDGVTGCLVPGGDRDAAAAALQTVSGLSRAACRRHAVEHLGLDAALDRHEALYADLRASARALTSPHS